MDGEKEQNGGREEGKSDKSRYEASFQFRPQKFVLLFVVQLGKVSENEDKKQKKQKQIDVDQNEDQNRA